MPNLVSLVANFLSLSASRIEIILRVCYRDVCRELEREITYTTESKNC